MALELNINYSTAKSIIRIYRHQGRVRKIPHKLRTRDRKAEVLSQLKKKDPTENRRPLTRLANNKLPVLPKYTEELEEPESEIEMPKKQVASSVSTENSMRSEKVNNTASKLCRIRFLDTQAKLNDLDKSKGDLASEINAAFDSRYKLGVSLDSQIPVNVSNVSTNLMPSLITQHLMREQLVLNPPVSNFWALAGQGNPFLRNGISLGQSLHPGAMLNRPLFLNSVPYF